MVEVLPSRTALSAKGEARPQSGRIARDIMLTFNVVSEPDGWGIHVNQCTSSHFRSREAALRQARLLAAAIRRHGVSVAVTIGDSAPSIAADYSVVGARAGAPSSE